MLARRVEDRVAAEDVAVDHAHGVPDDEVHPHRRRQVEDDVPPVHQLLDEVSVRDTADHVAKARVPLQRGEVLQPAGRQVVEHGHVVAAFHERLGEVRADEPGASGHEHATAGAGDDRAAHDGPPIPAADQRSSSRSRAAAAATATRIATT